MQSKLTKPWGPYATGTVVADNKAEADSTPGAIHVNHERYAKLHESGFFAPNERSSLPSRPIPAEVRTALPIAPPGMDKGGHNDVAPVTPRPESAPVGQGGKTPPAREP